MTSMFRPFVSSFISLFIVVALAGCFATVPTTPEADTIKEVPIAVKCEPVHVDKPILVLKGTAPQMSLFEKLKRALSDREELLAYSKKLEVANTACSQKSP